MLSRWKWFSAFDARKCEWMTAIQATGFGVFLGLPMPSLHHTPGLRAIADIIPEAIWAWVFAALGLVLLHCLHMTTAATWLAFARAALFLLIMAAYLTFGTAFLLTAPYSPVVYMYYSTALLLCGASFIGAMRAAGVVVRGWQA